MKPIKRIVAKCLLAVVILTNLGLTGLYQVTNGEAAIFATDIMIDKLLAPGGGLAINPNSGEVPIAKIRITNSGGDDWSLGAVNVGMSGAGFSIADLKPLTIGSTSGVSIFRDSNNNGLFDPGQDGSVQATSSGWAGNVAQLNFDENGVGTILPAATTTVLFLVIKTSDLIEMNDSILASFDAGSVTVRQFGNPTIFSQGPVAAITSNTFIAGGSANSITTPCSTSSSVISTSCYFGATTSIDHNLQIVASTTVVIKAGEIYFGTTTSSTLTNNGKIVIEADAALRLYDATSTLDNAPNGVIDLKGLLYANNQGRIINDGRMYINGKLQVNGLIDYNGSGGLGMAECNSSYGGTIYGTGSVFGGSTLPVCSAAAVTKPNLIFTSPQDATNNIPAGQDFKIMFAFDRTMDVSTIVTASSSDPGSNIFFTNDNGVTRIGGHVSYYPNPADCNASENNFCLANNLPNLGIFRPDGYLNPLKNYELRFTPGVHDVNGNSLNPNKKQSYYSLAFTTGPAICSGSECALASYTGGSGAYGAYLPPNVMGMLPAPGLVSAPTNSLVSIKFDKPLLASTVQAANIKIFKVNLSNWQDGAQFGLNDNDFTLSYDGSAINIKPAANFDINSKYRLKVMGALTGANGVRLGGTTTNDSLSMWSAEFNTGAGPSFAQPQINHVFPADSQGSVPVTLPSIRLQASKLLDAASINNQSVQVFAADGSPVVGRVNYDPLSKMISFVPSAMLATGTTYTVTASTSISDFTTAQNGLVAATSSFTTVASVDSTVPSIIGSHANDYKIEVYFNIPVESKSNASTSVLNLQNLLELRQGTSSDIWQDFAVLSTSSLALSYEAEARKLIIEGLSLAVGKDFYLQLAPGVAAVNGQMIAADGRAIRGRINPQTNISLGGTNGMVNNFDSNVYSIVKSAAGAPMSNLTGLKTSYRFNLPISKQVDNGGQVMIIFPENFNLTNAKPLPGSQYNADFNQSSAGVPKFDNSFDDDGVFVDVLSNRIVVQLDGATSADGNDSLVFELGDIVNSLMPADLSSNGYELDFQTRDAAGTVLENIEASPFYLQSGGNNSLNIDLNLAQSGDGGASQAKMYLTSSVTGPIEVYSDSFNAASTGNDASIAINALPDGDYTLYTDPIITLNSTDYAGINPPQSFHLSGGAASKNITLLRNTVGTALNVAVVGPVNQPLDIFASGAGGFKKQAVYLDGAGNGSADFNLPDGEWHVGVGPQMGSSSSGLNFSSLNFIIPVTKKILVSSSTISYAGTTTSSLNFNLVSANKSLKGTVTDSSSSTPRVMANAEVWAYDPQGGFGANAKADVNGRFILKLAPGKFKIGASVPGLPRSRELSIEVRSDNSVYLDGTLQPWLVTASDFDKLFLKLIKPDHVISGVVTDMAGNPTSNSAVWAYQTDGPGYANTQTGSDGRYQLFVSSGNWKVNSYLNGYGQLPANTVKIDNANQDNVNFSPAGANGYVYKTISGKVCVDSANAWDNDCSDGAPLSQSFVYAESFFGGGAKSINVTTDSTGQFVLNLAVPSDGSSVSYTLRAWQSNFGNFTSQVLNLSTASPNNTVAGHDFEKNTAREVLVRIQNNAGSAHVVSDAFIELRDSTSSAGNYLNIKNSDSGVLKLPDGNYKINAHVPGINPQALLYKIDGATSTSLEVAGAGKNLEIIMPALFALTGQVNGISEDIWVEAVDETSGVHYGVLATSTGGTVNYGLALPAGNYSLVTRKPGHISTRSTTTISDSAKTLNLVASAATLSLTGSVTTASGTKASFAFIRAEKTGSDVVLGAQADANGDYLLPISDGQWRLYAMGNGYGEKYFGQIVTVSGASQANRNFVLSTKIGLAAPLSQSIIPAQGGTVNANDLGLRLTIPANALSSDNTTGSVSINDVSNVGRGSLASPLGNRGREITAKDANGQEINNLRSGVTLEMTYSKADLDIYLPEIFGTTTWSGFSDAEKLAKVNNLKISYWNETSGSWVEQPSIVSLVGLTSAAPVVYSEVASVVVKGDSTHFTVFAVIMPFVVNNAETSSPAENNNPSNNSSTGGSGGGDASVTYCATVDYTDWGTCAGGLQSRQVKNAQPSGCTLTEVQVSAKKQQCVMPTTTATSTPVVEKAQEAVKKAVTNLTRLMDYLLGKLGLKRNSKKEALNEAKYVKPIITSVAKVTPEHKTTVTTFVNYGTTETVKLSDGERSLVVRTYRELFGKLPAIEKEWQDVIRMATEQAPLARNLKSEIAAQKTFAKIYKRKPNFKNGNDKKAMDILAYGLLPLKKDLKLETAANKKFRSVYKKNPKTDEEWKIARAIAYSKIKK